jgi:tetratricopeptide (TPR) repeat protein
MADVFVERFNDMIREKRYDDAQTEADKAVLLDPDYARGYVAQGIYYQSQKNTEEAIVRYIAGAGARYSSRARAAAHARLGALYWGDKMLSDKAEAEFKKALSLAPDLDEAHYLYGSFLEAQKRMDEAMAQMSTTVELNASHISARSALAQALYQKEDYRRALPHYEVLSRWVAAGNASNLTDKSKAEVHFRYGYCLAAKGDSRAAIEAYSRAIEKDAKFVLAFNNRGREHQRLREFDKAMENYREGLKVDPKDRLLNQNLGVALLESGRPEEARRQLELTRGLSPTNTSVQFDLARCWAALGKKKQALMSLQQAVASGYNDRSRLTSDRYLAVLQKEGDFKKLLLEMQ